MNITIEQIGWLLPDPRSRLPRDKELIRIMGVDEYRIHYDRWSDEGGWGIDRSGSLAYSQLVRPSGDGRFDYVRDEPLNEKQYIKHRPDLVLHACRTKNWQWSLQRYESIEDFETALSLQGVDLVGFREQPRVDRNKVTIIPVGPNGGLGKMEVIEAENGESFSPIEMLWRAHNVQSQRTSEYVDGVCLSRSGVAKGHPAYLCTDWKICSF